MRIPRIYTQQSLSSGTHVELEPGPAHHVGKVLRMQAGRELVMFNGEGGEYSAVIERVDKRSVLVAVGDFNEPEVESPLVTELVIGVSRGDRMDWVIQKATELGVTRIHPVFTGRTEVKLSGDRLEKRVQHWQQTLISACEQCGRTELPELLSPVPFSQILASPRAHVQYVLHHRAEAQLKTTKRPDSIRLLIGPEGGLSEGEIDQALAAGYQSLSLGPRIMRTETAPVAALAVLQFHWGDV